jgi:Zn-dependent protease with chaperone function
MTLQEMESHPVFRRALRRRNGYLIPLLILELALLVLLACLRIDTSHFAVYLDPWRWGTLARLVLSVAVLVGLSHWAYVKTFKGKGLIHLYPDDQSKGRPFGSLRGPELVAMVQKLAGELGVRHIDHIAVAKQTDPNAYTARILGLGNVVVLHSSLLQLLSRDEVRSILAHEIGHVRRKDSATYQLLSTPRTAAWVIVLINLAQLAERSVAWLPVIFAVAWLVSKVFGLLERLANRAAQQTELMVDAYAAQVCGWDRHLNALLLIGERAEALVQYLDAVRKVAGRLDDELNEKSITRLLNRLPVEAMDADRAVANAAGLYIVDRLTMLREKLRLPLNDEQIGDLAAQAAEALRQCKPGEESLRVRRDPDDDEDTEAEREKAREARRKEAEEQQSKEKELKAKLLFWRDYAKDQAGHLNSQELSRLVEDLRRQPERMVFRQFLEPDALWTDHPTMRDRILFLAELFPPHPSRV